ncbi:MAG: hypothetical protein IT559_06275 [Alphaproteobacteria bacterium]|nr:hypothetical protein [Alphaproteobacteria bacterium]
MIEAVNSVISNAPLIRIAADQTSAPRSFAADALAVESVARGPVAPYISPYIAVDPLLDAAVLQLRDSDTGDVVAQFPTDTALRLRQQQEAQSALSLPQSDGPGIVSESVTGGKSADFSTITFVQEAHADLPSPPAGGSGAAQAAITALSIGAQSGQVSVSAVSVTA